TRRRLRAAHSEPGRIVASPQETYEVWVQKARSLQEQPWSKTFYAAYMGGCFVGMAGLLSLVMGGNITANPTVRNLLFAALFPVNLLLVLQTGAQLFTGNAAIMAIGAFEGQVTMKSLLRNWGLSFLGNLLGCLTLSAVAQYTGLLTGGAASMAMEAVLSRCSSSFGQTLVKGVMCNWLLCAAIWLSTMAKGLSGKMVGIWFPISMFVGIGFEHSITNIFLLSSGLAAGAPATAADVIMKNLVPATIGNALAGALIVGAGMSYAFGRLGRAKKPLRVAFPSRRRKALVLLSTRFEVGRNLYNAQTQKKVVIVGKSKTSKDAVTDAQWDPLSDDYLLVSFADGSLTLYDASKQAEVHSFEKQSQAIRSLAWAKAQPGNFVSATDRVGLLKLWNVSQRSPMSQIKVGTSGVLCVKAIPSEPNWFVLSFKNSAVGVCDIASRTMRFLSSPGHSETIFDIAFHKKIAAMAAAEAFFFEVPDCPKGTILKLKAPDGKTLQIPLPQEAVPGDHMYLSKTEEGTWAFDKIIRHKYTKGAEDAAAIAMKTEEEVQKDLRGPETVQVQMDTTKGPIRLTIVPSWSPFGAQRALDMVRDGFLQDLAIYRGIKGFLVQFGVVDDEKKKAAYTPLPDDPLCGVPYLEGTVGFAAAGPNTRSCQLCLFL
ncbi:yrhG, partial [Symbiodinium sp. KB8]